MKKIIILVSFLVICFGWCAAARAAQSSVNPYESIGVYSGVGSNFQTSGSFNLGIKLRYLKYFPFGFEFVDVVPYGTEISFPLYLFHHPNFKFHLILPFTGFFIPWGRPISVKWLDRKKFNSHVDLVVGSGIEVQIKAFLLLKAMGFTSVSFNLDWRMIAPNPYWVLPNFGDYGRKIYRESAKEAQIWIGITIWH
jgi:hypothetical protein